MVSMKYFCKSVSVFVHTFVVENVMFSKYKPMYHEINLVPRILFFFFKRENPQMVILTTKKKSVSFHSLKHP